ncbi:hypothetical protein FKP32DRAFT_588148 [Trametes sanguinea]|nr:hypothetical protein FKP32DRAFT_588148 [Trametes sanguinea]
MLNEMRFGRLTPKSIARFKSLQREIIYEDGLGATELFPRREDVERSNTVRMGGITGKEQVYTAYDGGSIQDLQQREKMLANFMAPKRLVLKEGAQVMLIKNMDETLVNGTMGKILGFVDPAAPPDDVGMLGGDKPASKGTKDTKSVVAPVGRQLLPLVEFLGPGGSRRRIIVTPENWKVELPSGEVQVSRTQACLAASDPLVGDVHSQVSRSDVGACQGRSRKGLREGPSIRCALSSHFAGRPPGFELRPF